MCLFGYNCLLKEARPWGYTFRAVPRYACQVQSWSNYVIDQLISHVGVVVKSDITATIHNYTTVRYTNCSFIDSKRYWLSCQSSNTQVTDGITDGHQTLVELDNTCVFRIDQLGCFQKTISYKGIANGHHSAVLQHQLFYKRVLPSYHEHKENREQRSGW